MSWFDDLASLRQGGQSAEYARTRADEPNFMISGHLPFVLAKEVEIDLRDCSPRGDEASP